MSTKMATLSRKAVFTTVYVERPRRRRGITFQPIVIPKGYNRKADLLLYSQGLRDSVRRKESTLQTSHHKPGSINNQKSLTNIVPAARKTKYGRRPSCFGNWKVLIPKFLRSLKSRQAKKKNKNNGSTGTKIKAATKRLQVKKKWGSVSKKFTALRKYR